MKKEMIALEENKTWDLVLFFSRKESSWISVGVHCEANLEGSLARLKTCLVAKRYPQTYKMNYKDTFSSGAKLTSMQILVSLVAIHH